jgi:nucleoside-diphosphate-sugar epimerase
MLCSTEQELEALLAAPYPEDIEFMSRLSGDIVFLGAGGKMGPTLVARAVAANRDPQRKIYAVARHGEFPGATVVRADLSDRKQVDTLLPDAPNVMYLVGRKFGSTGAEHLTWSTNAIVPALACERYIHSRVVALSTGNVYPFVPVESGGATEAGTQVSPVGEYAWSALARERVFQYFSIERGLKTVLVRLNYAVEYRYGTLVDIAQKVLNREPIDVTMGYFNCIWQGDANSVCLRAFDLCESPARILNLTGKATLRVRDVAQAFGKRLGVEPIITGEESATALLSNASECERLFGPAHVTLEQMVDGIADWLQRGGATLGKPTHFEVRTGKF